MRLAPFALSVSLLATTLTTALPATQASAACAEVGKVGYSISNVSRSRILTNKRSDYLEGPGTINYSSSTTATASASGTATVGTEANAIFAKASGSIGVTVGGSWSHSGTWSYTKPVPNGRTARLVMWHESRSFTVKKWRIVAPCNVQYLWTKRVNAPRRSNINVWGLQYA